MTERRAITAYLTAVLLVACSESTPTADLTGPDSGKPFSSDTGAPPTSPALVECPSSASQTTEATVGLLGGVVKVGGASVSIPLGALLQPTRIVLTIPASRYMEIDVSVPGTEHFLFQKPIAMTIDYSRCSGSVVDGAPLTAWHIDGETKALLEARPTVDVKLTRTAVFTTIHLSGYALAN